MNCCAAEFPGIIGWSMRRWADQTDEFVFCFFIQMKQIKTALY